jgi:imidazolonepropionase
MSDEQLAVSRLRLEGIGRLYPMADGFPEVIEDAVVLIEEDSIVWVGPASEAPEAGPEDEIEDLNGAMVTPGWIDSHTHLVWAGSRQNEFRMRLEGRTYLDIAQEGGGIMSTVRAVRETSLEELVTLAQKRVQRLLSFGVTTAEAKSGYGLDTASELKLLEAIQLIDQTGPLELVPTCLAAHTIPTERKGDRDSYIELVCKEILPEVARRGLAESCDVFVENGAFTLEEGRAILSRGKELGLVPRIHADQLSAGGGAGMAAELGAASADHLEEISDEDIQKLADHGVVACLIPGSTFCLRQHRYAPARKMLDAGVTVALATDLNPGTTCSENLAMLGTIACIHMDMSPMEVLASVTRGAARSLKREGRLGSLAPGFQADVVVFDAPDVDYLFYHYGVSHVQQVLKKGAFVWHNPL